MLDVDMADTMEAMSASLVYLLLRQVLQMLTQFARDSGAKDVELLVLRCQVAVLRRPACAIADAWAADDQLHPSARSNQAPD
ncbi:hypothetical protein ABZS66_12380 [Dactylosporangium sp. NPDC005572]|uniref:hypothetical protein n=1 Tax=Dactylosporangium sp. NPDC005572 TaxID=3156889 RepID=UPI0033A9ED73